ncbi:MAG TPA: ABC transporter ATP-binding protein [Ktedonobacteraceae bacterium]
MSALIALRSYLYRYRVAMIGGFLFLICANIAALFLPYLIRLAIDSLQAGANGSLLVRYAVLIIVAGAVQAVLAFYGRYFQAKASRQIEYELRANLFKHFEKLELDYFQHHKVGDLVARATNDLTAIRGMLGPGISNLMNTIVAFTVTITFMLTIDIQLTLYAAIILPMITVVFIVVGRQIEHRYKAVQDQFGEVSAHAQENLSGIRMIKAYRQEDHELEAFRAANHKYMHLSISYARIYAILWPAMFFLAGIASVILLWRGGLDVIHGRISLGQLVQFMGYLAQLTWPMIAFGWVVNLFQQGSASMIRINEVMHHTPTIADTVKTGERPTELILKGKVEFHHVTFSYGEHEVLHDINFKVEAGSSLAIVGPTGCGKSTLVNLVPRLFNVDQGQLLIDDINVRQIPLASLRHQIGFVPQETFLFSVPLSENIGFGVKSLSEQRMQEVMEFAQLGKDVNDFPQGTATMIGERGVTLSGGQKQRTALARAIAKDPAILILDDAMSSVDTHTEAEILGHLRNVMQGRTTIVISHRCSTVKNLDHIIVLDEGRIVEEGNHEKLLQEHGLYAEMYRRQLIGEELEESDNGDLFSGR